MRDEKERGIWVRETKCGGKGADGTRERERGRERERERTKSYKNLEFYYSLRSINVMHLFEWGGALGQFGSPFNFLLLGFTKSLIT